jgi:hypothetical protein
MLDYCGCGSRQLFLPLCVFFAIAHCSAALSLSSPSSDFRQMASSAYPRPLHPGGFSLPPLVEDRLPIVTAGTATTAGQEEGAAVHADILLVRPPDMESLWEWLAYTKHQTDSDPSWGRVWPTALSLSRLVLRSLKGHDIETKDRRERETIGQELTKRAFDALRTSSHAVELGCGLGVVGLVFALASATNDETRTITFLDRGKPMEVSDFSVSDFLPSR